MCVSLTGLFWLVVLNTVLTISICHPCSNRIVENKALILLALSLIVAADKLGLRFFFGFIQYTSNRLIDDTRAAPALYVVGQL